MGHNAAKSCVNYKEKCTTMYPLYLVQLWRIAEILCRQKIHTYTDTFCLLCRFVKELDKCLEHGQQPKTLLLLGLIDDPTTKTIGQ